MKSISTKTQLLATWLLVIVVITACAPSTPVPTSTPTSTSTPIPTSTFTPSPTPTKTPTPTPTPVLVSVIKDTVLYGGPSKDGYEEIMPLTAGTNVEPLGKFVDFVFVSVFGGGVQQDGYIPSVMLGDLPEDLPVLTSEDVPWKVIDSVTDTIVRENKGNNFIINAIKSNIRFSEALQIDLKIESSKGAIGIELWADATPTHWIELYFEESNLHFMVNSSGRTVYEDYLPMPYANGVTTGELTLRFDQFGKKIQILQQDEVFFEFGVSVQLV